MQNQKYKNNTHMKHILSIIICLIIVTTGTAQVKFTQLERAATQWSLPVAKRVVPGISDYVMTYMTLAQLIDSTETILGTRIDSMKMTTNDTLALYTSDGIFKTKIVITHPSDSTVVENDYGTIIVESPSNTFGITVDSSLFMTTHDGTQKQDAITGTTGQTLRFSGTNTLTANSLLYNDGSSIGVGTTSPQSKLQVQGSGDQYLTTTTTSVGKAGFFFNYNNIAHTGMKIYYNANDANVYFDNLYPYDGVNNFGDVIWRTTPVTIGSQVTAMTLKGNGRLGLGTALPSQLLHVSGNTRLTGLFYDGNNEAGTAGQILSSTGAITDWITPAADSTVVENDYGTIITESPDNTYGVTVDSSKFATTYDINGMVTGSGVANKVAFWTGTNTLSSTTNFHWNNTLGRLSIGNALPVSALDVTGRFQLQNNVGSVFIGNLVGNETASGGQNTGIGVANLGALTTGTYNMAIGNNIMGATTNGASNIGIGNSPLYSLSSGTSNIGIGSAALYLNNGTENVGIGYRSIFQNTGNFNTAVGTVSLYSAGSGSQNTAVGYGAGYSTTGAGNVFLGMYGGFSETGSNTLYIANAIGVASAITGNFASGYFGVNQLPSAHTRAWDINGELRVRDLTTTTPDRLMSADADGVVSSLGLSGLSISGGNLVNSNTGTVTSIATTAPITGGTITGTGTIGITSASAGVTGALTGTDWTTFNNKFTLPSLTSGSVLISDGSTISQENGQLFWDFTNNRLGIGTNLPTNTLSVAGVMKVTGSASGNTVLWGRHPTNFTMGAITVGSGLSLSGDNLTASATGTVTSVQLSAGTGISIGGTNPVTTSGTISVTNTAPNVNANLTFSGSSSPYTLNSSDGTDVTFAAGTGISLSRSSNELTITNSSSGMTSWLLAASGTAGTQSITNGTTATITAGTSMTATRSSGNVTVGVASGGITTTQIADGTVALADIADIGNAGQVVGTITGSGSPVAISIGTGLQIQSSAITNLSSNYGYLFHSSGTIGGQSISTTPLTVNFNDQMQGLQMTCNTTSDYVQVTNSGGYEIDYGICVGGISSTRQISVQVYVGSSSVPGTLKRFFIDSGDEDCAHGKHLMDLTAGQQVFLKVATSGSETATFDGPQLKVTRIY